MDQLALPDVFIALKTTSTVQAGKNEIQGGGAGRERRESFITRPDIV